jgi:quercetin dioxygenase-like cupin family protein
LLPTSPVQKTGALLLSKQLQLSRAGRGSVRDERATIVPSAGVAIPDLSAILFRRCQHMIGGTPMRRTATILSVFVLVISFSHTVVSAQAAGSPNIIQADALTWAPAQGLPPGAQIAVLYGNPSKKGPFAVRFKFPSGYEVATHSHPTDELLTVISGKARMAFGAKADEAHAQPLPAGAFMILPAGAWHRLWTDAETIVELHSTGPFSVKLAK